MMTPPEPVVNAGIAGLERGRASVVAGWMNKFTAQTNRISPRAMQRKIMQHVMSG
ncbi:hypothetical protein SAJA_02135 [Salinisphaera japonica YTM-1]|uniref:Uncharacterized protein n=1 Tax=Salinisphaera japonica YTM-1 TaxID=1209778 RepID=A0A423Q165_9GAMM|nr:hypothetical protein SAJA_02135 [Salinisphaera japonica YTM-1]